jgi:tetratricopeptide (TPR) repeat protein
MLFAIHPLQTEAVAWATGMKDLLSGLLALGAIWRYLRAMEGEGRTRRMNYAVATALYVLALLSKPSAVAVPGMVWVLDMVIFGRSWKKSLLRITPWLALAAGATVVAAMIQSTQMLKPVSPWHRPLIAADALAFYLYKLMVPIRLSCDYGRTPAAVLDGPLHPLYWTWLVPVVLALVLWRTRSRTLIASGLIFLIGLLPVLGLVTFIYQFYSTVADRYVYVSMLGVSMAAAWLVQRLGSRLAYAAAAVVLAALAGASFAQAGIWRNAQTLYEYAWAINPDHINPLHLDKLAQYLDRRSAQEQQSCQAAAARADVQEAIRCFSRSIQLDPLFPRVYDDLCDDLVRARHFDEAVEVGRSLMNVQPQLAAELRQKPAVLHYRMGMLYYRAGRWAEAAEQFRISLQQEPTADAGKMLQAARQQMHGAAATRP